MDHIRRRGSCFGVPWSASSGKGSALKPTHLVVLFALAASTPALVPPIARAAGQPQVDAAWVTGVTATSANLHAEINPNGLATSYRFEYVTEAEFQVNLAANPPRDGFSGAAEVPGGTGANLGSASVDIEALQHIAALRSSTTYRYRATAANSAGTTPSTAHAFTTEEISPAFLLLDGRDWEMVSPIEKNGGAIQGFGQNFGGDILQAATDGNSATFSSASSFGEGAQGAPAASQYLARRGTEGWTSENITTPLLSGSYGDNPDGVPYQIFSTDLLRGLLSGGQHCRGGVEDCPVANPPLPGTEAPAGYQNYYLRDDEDGSFRALLTDANNDELALSAEQFDLSFAGATPDLRHVILSTCAALTHEATEAPGINGCDPSNPNLYEWSGSSFHLVNLLPGEAHGTPGATLAAQSLAISANGSLVVWADGGDDHDLYLRDTVNGETVQLDTIKGGSGGGTVEPRFQTASADGSRIFFTDAQQLTAGSGISDLYQCEIVEEGGELQCKLSDLTPDGEVKGVLGASEDGSYLYFVANGVLSNIPNAQGEHATSGNCTGQLDESPAHTCNLYLDHDGAIIFIATLGAADAGDWNAPNSSIDGTARVTPDGTHLAFDSTGSLTGYDNTDQRRGTPDSEVYLYGAAPGGGGGTLTCVSCNPTGERPSGSSSIPGTIANGKGKGATDAYKPRNLSVDGARLFFDSGDALAPQDSNAVVDVYEWEAHGAGTCQAPGACIGLISSGRSSEASSFVDASADGRDAFFLTDSSLVSTDPGSIDLYDARVGGGFPQPSPPIACVGDACQPLPVVPEDPTPGTLVSGQGNPAVHFPSPHHQKHHHHHKKHHPKREGHNRRSFK